MGIKGGYAGKGFSVVLNLTKLASLILFDTELGLGDGLRSNRASHVEAVKLKWGRKKSGILAGANTVH